MLKDTHQLKIVPFILYGSCGDYDGFCVFAIVQSLLRDTEKAGIDMRAHKKYLWQCFLVHVKMSILMGFYLAKIVISSSLSYTSLLDIMFIAWITNLILAVIASKDKFCCVSIIFCVNHTVTSNIHNNQ